MTTDGRVGNPRFFACTGPHGLDAVARAAGCVVDSRPLLLSGIAALASARPDEVSFLSDHRRAAELKRTRAAAVLVAPDMKELVPAGTVPLVTNDPVGGWARVAALFHPAPRVRAGIHASAVVDPDARIDPSAEIGPGAVIGVAAEIGPQCRVGAGALIDDGVVLGPECVIGAHATISHALLGARVHVYPGARIGQAGFGFAMTESGFRTVPQLGAVILEDDVEVGANTTIDRGSLRDTVIGAGTRLDNLVQIAHGVRIGRNCAIAAQVGISGSAEIGDFVVIGGQAGIADHVRVGGETRIGAQSGVMSEIAAGSEVVGSPARPARQVFREIATLKRLAAGRALTRS